MKTFTVSRKSFRRLYSCLVKYCKMSLIVKSDIDILLSASSFRRPGRLPDGLRGLLDHPPSQSWWSGWSQGWLNSSRSHKTSLNGFRQLQNRRFQALRCPPAFFCLHSLQIAPAWCGDLSRVGVYYVASTFTKKIHLNLQSGALGSDFSEMRRCGNTQ